MAAEVVVGVDDQRREERVEEDGQQYSAMDGTFYEAEDQRPTAGFAARLLG